MEQVDGHLVIICCVDSHQPHYRVEFVSAAQQSRSPSPCLRARGVEGSCRRNGPLLVAQSIMRRNELWRRDREDSQGAKCACRGAEQAAIKWCDSSCLFKLAYLIMTPTKLSFLLSVSFSLTVSVTASLLRFSIFNLHLLYFDTIYKRPSLRRWR